MHKISACVITYNDEHTVAWSVGSVQWAHEVVVVDTGSTDRTIEIAERLGARVVPTAPFAGFGEMRNRALEHCTHDWVFSVDADEHCTRPLQDEIMALLAGEPAHDAYYDPRLRLVPRSPHAAALPQEPAPLHAVAVAREPRAQQRGSARLDRERAVAFSLQHARGGPAQGQPLLLARRAGPGKPARLDVERARPRAVGVCQAVHLQARLRRRVGRVHHCAVKFRRNVLSLRQGSRESARLGRAARRTGAGAAVVAACRDQHSNRVIAPCAMGNSILIAGRSGRIARDLIEAADGLGLEVTALGRPDLDLTDRNSVARVVEGLAPRAIVNAAGLVVVDDAERDPQHAFAINCDGPAHLAAAAARAGVPLLHLSSDYVFDGAKMAPYREDDALAPPNEDV